MTDPVVPPRPPLPTDATWAQAYRGTSYDGSPADTADTQVDGVAPDGHPAHAAPAQAAVPWGPRFGHASGAADAAPVFAAPYSAPATGGWAPPTAGPSRTLGILALALAVVASVGSSIVGGVASYRAGLGLSTYTPDLAGLRFLSPVRDWVLLAEVAFWAGTALGVWSLAQGIVAIVGRRGRGFAIAAVVMAPLGFVLFAAVVWFALWAGIFAQPAAGGITT